MNDYRVPMSTHTPRPWTFDEDVGIVYGPKRQKVVLTHVGANFADMELIAAAPDLLDALQEIAAAPDCLCCYRTIARSAIAKLEGK